MNQEERYLKSGYTLIIYKKFNWLTNSYKKGALDFVIKDNSERNTSTYNHNKCFVLHSNVFKVVNTTHQHIFTKLFIDEVITLTKKNIGLYEVLKFPCKVYFDYDLKNSETISKIKLQFSNEQYIQNVKNFLLEYFPNAIFAISSSFTDEKISMHIVLTNYIIVDEAQYKLLKHFVISVLHSKDTSFDTAVYGKNQCMKMINQSKLIGRRMEDRIQSILENNEPAEHFINLFDGYVDKFKVSFDLSKFNSIDYLEHNDDVLVSFENDKFTKKFNLSNLPKITFSNEIDIDTLLYNKINTLNLLPIDSTFDFKYKHRIARWCFNNNISFDTFFSWKCNSNTSNSEDKWKIHWNNLHRFPVVLDDVIICILKKYYPAGFYKAEFKKFKKQFDIGPQTTLTKTIKNGKVESINSTHFSKTKISIFNLPMGFGKSYSTMNYIKNKPSVLYITLNIALARNIYCEFNEENCTEFSLYLNFN